MKNNAWMSIPTALKVSLLSSALLLCFFGSITSRAVTHAVSSKCPSHAQHCVSTPTPTSAPTPIVPQPPQIHPYPTRIVQPVSTRIAGNPPPATRARATATAGIVTSHQRTTPRTDATPAKATRDQGTTNSSDIPGSQCSLLPAQWSTALACMEAANEPAQARTARHLSQHSDFSMGE